MLQRLTLFLKLSVLASLGLAVPAGAVTLTIAENGRVTNGNIVSINDGLIPPTATDDQFQQSSPDNLNAAFAAAGAFTGPFGATEIIRVFGVLAGGQDPVFGAFASPFTVTLDGVSDRGATPGAQGRFEVRQGGTGGTIVSQVDFVVGDSNVAIFDSSTLDVGTGVFEFRIIGTGLNGDGQVLNYDFTIAGFTEIPLPASLALLLAALGIGVGFHRRSWRSSSSFAANRRLA
ncbi:MAG: hypothetical protein AAGC81_12660 [Pseudomonadota bacterium]